MQPLVPAIMFLSVLFPTKMWYAPNQPLTIDVKTDQAVTLMLTDFAGRPLDATKPADVSAGGATLDVKSLFAALDKPGTYVLYAVPQGKSIGECVGTPLVIESRLDKRKNAPPTSMVVRVTPLCYVTMDTTLGTMKAVLYYDAAPNTADTFARMAGEGFYDGLIVHRVVPGFVIQTGDPRGDGTGSAGYTLPQEFNDKPLDAGVLAMARSEDPNEGTTGVAPRSEYANSAGTQFFICLDYESTQQLDRRYTAFGKLVQGLDVAQKIGKLPLASAKTGMPAEPPVIRKIEVKPVTAQENPYLLAATTQPTTQPLPPAAPVQPSTAPASR